MKTFLHNFKYTIKILFHDKSLMIWSFGFILVLGTLFYASFGNVYANNDLLHSIKVCVQIEDEEVKYNFDNIIANISLSEDGEKLLEITDAADMEEAEKLLTDGKIKGIFYSGNGELRLMVYNDWISESILSTLVGQYHQIVTIVTELSLSGKTPDMITIAMNELISGNTGNAEKKTTDGNTDVYLTYFYNLIAMACLMSVGAGITFTINNQANLSTIGARKCISGAASFAQSASGILATVVVQTVISLLGFLYLLLIGVDFGNQIGYIALIILCGCLAGTCLGFFVGSIGRLSRGVKESIGVAITVGTSFFSGLMVADMRMIVENSCPIINKINPAAMISDSFYALQIYDTYDRYFRNLQSLLIVAVIALIAGILLGRRKSYASI